MLTLLLLFHLAFGQDLPLLQHEKPHHCTIAPHDPVLEGFGPSKTFRYRLEGEDSVLHIYALAGKADLALRVIEDPAEPASKYEGATSLFVPKKDFEVFADDDGGLDDPFVRIGYRGGGAVLIQVGAKGIEEPIEALVHVFEAVETLETHELVERVGLELSQLGAPRSAEELNSQRRVIERLLEDLAPSRDNLRSDALADAIWRMTSMSSRLGAPTSQSEALLISRRYDVRRLPPGHREYLKAIADIGLAYSLEGDLSQSLECRRRALEGYLLVAEENDLVLHGMRINMASTLKKLNDLPGALAYEREALEAQLEHLGPDDPGVLDTRLRLAVTLRSMERLEEASAEQQKVVESFRHTRPENDPDRLGAQESLALTLRELGELDRAIELQEEVLTLRQNHLPKNHPNVVRALLNLVDTLRRAGKRTPALDHLEEYLAAHSSRTALSDPILQQAQAVLASVLIEMGEARRAIDLLKSLIGANSRRDVVLDLELKLAAAFHAVGEYQQALALQEAVLRARLSSDLPAHHPKVQAARSSLASTLYSLDKLREAADLQEETLRLYEQHYPDGNLTAQIARGNLALTLNQMGDYERALELETRVLEVYSRKYSSDHRETLAARYNLAGSMASMGRLHEARDIKVDVEKKLSEILPRHGIQLQTVRLGLAETLVTLGDLVRAKELQELALGAFLAELEESHPEVQRARVSLSGSLQALGDLEGAEKLQRDALEVYSRQLEDGHPTIESLRVSLAGTLLSKGELREARRLNEEVIERLQSRFPKTFRTTLVARASLAAALTGLGELPKAIALQEEVLADYLDIYSENSAHPDILVAKFNLASMLLDLGELEGARSLQEEVLRIQEAQLPEYHPRLNRTRAALGTTLATLGRDSEAKELEKKALSELEKSLGPENRDVLGLQINLGNRLRDSGDPEAGLELQRRAYSTLLARRPVEHPDLVNARLSLARTLMAIGEADEAKALVKETADNLPPGFPTDHPDRQRVRIELARMAARTRQPDAIVIAREIGTIARDLVRSPASLSERRINAALGLDTLLSITRLRDDSEAILDGNAIAFSVCESQKAVPAAAARLRSATARDPEARRLLAEVQELGRRLQIRAANPRAGGKSVAELELERRRKDEALQRRAAESSSSGALFPDITAAAVSAALAPGEAAVSFWIYPRWEPRPNTDTERETLHLLAWVLRPGQPLQRVELGELAPIARNTSAWIADRLRFDAGRPLANAIWKPLEAAIGAARRVWLVPAGDLHRIPFDVLPVEPGFLGARHQLVQVSSLAELLTRSSAAPIGAAAHLLALGDIDYGHAEGNPGDPPQNRGAPARSVRQRGARFGRLEHTRAELRQIERLFNDSFQDGTATLFTRSRATRGAFEREAPAAHFLHLATHGWFAALDLTSDSRSGGLRSDGARHDQQVWALAPALLTGLAFAGANVQAAELGRVPAVMTAEELSDLDLSRVRLAVLSACETNRGEVRGGQGMASLQAALHAAGVRTAITSLWQVPDEATQELMVEFYRRLWVEKEPAAAALWNAKMALYEARRGRGKSSTSFMDWAGWVLSGDPD